MSLHYAVYGLWLSSDLPIPGLKPFPPRQHIDVHIWLSSRSFKAGELPGAAVEVVYSSFCQNGDGEPALVVSKMADGAYFWLRYADGTEFVIDRLGTQVWASWAEQATLEDTATYLLGPVLGFVLRLRGTTSLHASGVVVDGQAIALVGPPLAGKSTTAAAFAKRGYPALTDDVLPILEQGDSFLVPSGYPRICLWPDSVEALYGSPEVLPRLTLSWDKRYLDLNDNGHRFPQHPAPLAAIYVLGERAADPMDARVETLPAQAGFIHLVRNTYVNYLLDSGMRAREFELLGRVVVGVPLRLMQPQADPRRLSRLCDVILEDFETLVRPDLAARDAR